MAAKIVQYRGNIYILEASKAYRREVERVLKLMMSTQAGQALVKHINLKANYMLISPYDPKKEAAKNGWVNAYEYARTEADGAPAGYVVSKTPINLPFGVHFDIPTSIGTGKGSIVDLHYHPATWREVNKRSGRIAPGEGPGEVLFHEMTHGLRDLCGLMRYNDLVDDDHKDSVEEFYAIMAANVYRSDRGFTMMRSDHSGNARLEGALVYQSAYYERYASYIDKWFDEQRTFCLDMARVGAKFNPFREAAIARKLMTGSATSMRL